MVDVATRIGWISAPPAKLGSCLRPNESLKTHRTATRLASRSLRRSLSLADTRQYPWLPFEAGSGPVLGQRREAVFSHLLPVGAVVLVHLGCRVGPVPRFPAEMEQRIDDHLKGEPAETTIVTNVPPAPIVKP
jgi:hypothetical protein